MLVVNIEIHSISVIKRLNEITNEWNKAALLGIEQAVSFSKIWSPEEVAKELLYQKILEKGLKQ